MSHIERRSELRRIRADATKAATLLGATLLFGSLMTGQALSEPAGRGERPPSAPGRAGAGEAAGEARAGQGTKVTLCHATGSATNPYVVITIDEHGHHGHDGHEGDIVPVPPEGCPAPGAERRPPPGAERRKVTLCHATGSRTNPYVVITIDEHGLHGHDGHEGDIVPAPTGGCPRPTGTVRPAVVTARATPLTTAPPTTAPPITAPPTTAPPSTAPGTPTASAHQDTLTSVVAADAPVRPDEAHPAKRVLGFRLESMGAATLVPGGDVATAVLGATIDRSGGTLPRTGSSVTTLVMCGLALVLAGTALRHGARTVRSRG